MTRPRAAKASWLATRAGLNAVCPYYTMFPLGFPLRVLSRASSTEAVLDPFCGRGTTIFAARLLGMESVGVDVNPVAVAIARAKLASGSVDAVVTRAEGYLSNPGPEPPLPEGDFWDLCYERSTLAAICRIRAGLLAATDDDADVLLRAIVLGLLHGPVSKGLPSYLSNQMPRTYAAKPRYAVKYWTDRDLKPARIDVAGLIRRRASRVLRHELPPGSGSVLSADARSLTELGERRFSWVVTSPPYFGMRTYSPDQWLRNWFLGGPAAVDYSSPGSLPTTDEAAFVTALAEVWRSVAATCKPGARMAIRFGSLPSARRDHRRLLKDSLAESRAGWRILTARKAGQASDGRRQATQFGALSLPEAEVDLYARLEV